MRMYWRQGMKKGLSPENYIKKLTDMTEKGKQLNWIKADFNETSCLNVISQVGFGQGALRIEGNFRRSLDYLLVLQESKEMHKFSSGDIKQVTLNDFVPELYR
ncbi:uncharacterized protein LOC134851427 [Symsagittifera roscoffensis]|uniref:uncharacterized protein LOC134851427 n=1 Tax=Symsagittifera roscoffensis TaxID=84072 RepID=UPI00307C0077